MRQVPSVAGAASNPATLWAAAMRQGDYAAAWAVNDAVLARRTAPPDDPHLPYHLRHVWDGRAFDARDVLVRCYHGLGDTLQFARYLPALAARAASVTLEAQPELVALLRGLPGVRRLIAFDVAAPAPPAACDIEVMELAHALRLPPEAIAVPYLPAPLIAAAPPSRPGPYIGLCARAGNWDPERSVPLSLLAAALPQGACPVRLQREDADALDWANPDATLADIAETAALVGGVDLVITVDTMLAHLAGALGRPTWLLLKAEADWRWGIGPRPPWYPSMRLYRQRRPGEWREPLAELARDLAGFSRPPSPRAGARAG